MKWTFADAVNLALDMREHGEVAAAQLDKTVNELWEEMQCQNEQMDE